jgi:aminoglycoside phosphotransferase family enzyme/predicted kinase
MINSNSKQREYGSLQPEVEAAFADPNFYPHPVEHIHVEETHISKVFLTGSLVYKVKKPVEFGFLDYGTLEKRKYFCEQEIILNQRLSHDVYLGLVTVTNEPAGCALNGPGEPREYAVKMQQLPEERTMEEILHKNDLSPVMVQGLALVLADFYGKAEKGEHIDYLGSVEMIETNVEENFAQTEPFVSDILNQAKFAAVRQAAQAFLQRKHRLFQRRIDTGRIRDCHGDLRLDHVYFMEDIQIIDCIEFNERFRYGDVAADLAYLAMDLDDHDVSALGRVLINSYAVAAEDPEIFALLDFYKCYRAHVRCKVECLRHAEGGLNTQEQQETREKAQRHFDLAHNYAKVMERPTMWVICGLSASGKSTIAGELAKRLQIQMHSSDLVRKQLFGLGPKDAARASFKEGIYTEAATEETYKQLLFAAREELVHGRSTIVDATFGKLHHRDQARKLASELGVNIIFAECTCPEQVLRHRLTQRRDRQQVSDARLEHFEDLLHAFEPLDELADSMHLKVASDNSLMGSMVELFTETYVRQGQQAREHA